MGSDAILYQFSRCQVERGNFGHFLSLYALNKLPKGRRLGEMMNSMVFCVEGWDSDSREIYTIPEIRRFYSSFHKAWTYWLYFCSLEMDNLKTMVACCLPELKPMQVDGKATVAVTFDLLPIEKLLAQDFLPMTFMCERAEMFEERIYDRTRAVFEYFGLPFDVGPSGPTAGQ